MKTIYQNVFFFRWFFGKLAKIILFFFLFIITVSFLLLLVYIFIAQPHQIIGHSMWPNYKDKEYVVSNRLSYRFRSPARGDVVIYISPYQGKSISRIVGLPGEKIQSVGGRVFINNQPLAESYLQSGFPVLNVKNLTDQGGYLIVPSDSYFLLGDNRATISSSLHERDFVSRQNVIGKVWFCYANCPSK
jgi:signal peptidase I